MGICRATLCSNFLLMLLLLPSCVRYSHELEALPYSEIVTEEVSCSTVDESINKLKRELFSRSINRDRKIAQALDAIDPDKLQGGRASREELKGYEISRLKGLLVVMERRKANCEKEVF